MFIIGVILLGVSFLMLIGGFASEDLIKSDGETIRIDKIWFWIMTSALILGIILISIATYLL